MSKKVVGVDIKFIFTSTKYFNRKKMTTIDQALETIKTNKIGKGCKISYSSNKIYIDYPIHKTLNGQYNADIRKVKELFTDNHLDFCCIQNKGGINIWI